MLLISPHNLISQTNQQVIVLRLSGESAKYSRKIAAILNITPFTYPLAQIRNGQGDIYGFTSGLDDTIWLSTAAESTSIDLLTPLIQESRLEALEQARLARKRGEQLFLTDASKVTVLIAISKQTDKVNLHGAIELLLLSGAPQILAVSEEVTPKAWSAQNSRSNFVVPIIDENTLSTLV